MGLKLEENIGFGLCPNHFHKDSFVLTLKIYREIHAKITFRWPNYLPCWSPINFSSLPLKDKRRYYLHYQEDEYIFYEVLKNGFPILWF